MEKYISLERSLELISNETQEYGEEVIKTGDSLNRRLAGNILADNDIPGFNKSAMDGYAVNLDPTQREIPVLLKVKSVIEAGGSAELQLRPNEAVKIMTGAPVPKDAVAVIMKEKVEKMDENTIKTGHIPGAMENIISRGEDIKKGDVLIKNDTIIGPSHISLLASQGITEVKVKKHPGIGIISTGSEIVSITEQPGQNQLRNSNARMLKSLFDKDNIETIELGIARDEENILQQAISIAFEQFDLIITSGGVSAGDKDLIIPVMEKIGFRGIFHQVMIKPGRPVFFAKNKNKTIIALPGNPVSAYLGYLLFVKAYLFGTVEFIPARLDFGYDNRSDLTRFIPVKVNSASFPSSIFEKVKYNGSSDMVGLSKATHFLVLEKQTDYETGDTVNSIKI